MGGRLAGSDKQRHKANETYSTYMYKAYWPEAYTDFLITPNNKKQSAVNTLSELTTIQKNEKETQTSITYNKHKQTIYHKLSTIVGPVQRSSSFLTLGTQINIFVLPHSLTPLQTKKQKQRSQRMVEVGASPWRRRPPGWPCYWVQ